MMTFTRPCGCIVPAGQGCAHYAEAPATYHGAAIHWDEYGKPRAKHPPCLICGADEIGSLYDGAWCHCCAWRGPLLALLAHAKERANANAVVAAALAHENARQAFEWSAENEDRPAFEAKRAAMQQAHRELIASLSKIRR